jgi:peptidoglycan lytic transglycosylase D
VSTPQQASPSRVPRLTVRTGDGRLYSMVNPFSIGREVDCDVRIEDGRVSRKHAIVSFEGGRWIVRDQQSGNGVYVAGRRVEAAPIDGALSITLGADGPGITFDLDSHAAPPQPPVHSETMILAKYFGELDDNAAVGGRTMMIRQVFQKVQQRQRRKYTWLVAAAATLMIAALGYAYYKNKQLEHQKTIAEDLFYSMKSLDVDIANLEQLIASSGNAQSKDQVQQYLERRKQMESNYDRFISGLNLYDHALSPQEQVILRVTRQLGECDMAAPPEYLAVVGSYIKKWQSSGKFARAINRAQSLGYPRKIVDTFQKQNLPPQFFYLALQESEFNETASGPPTRWGYAKGMWQLIPETAKRYGLTIGPLVAYPRPDPGDDRHNWEKATGAAARYIKTIYSTDAQASGLLVMASYNWGEQRVINMIKTLPQNPRERNFWKLLERYREKMPNETYNYVLSIVAAAVIGENPRLFGFAFDNPLAFTDTVQTQSGS